MYLEGMYVCVHQRALLHGYWLLQKRAADGSRPCATDTRIMWNMMVTMGVRAYRMTGLL